MQNQLPGPWSELERPGNVRHRNRLPRGDEGSVFRATEPGRPSQRAWEEVLHPAGPLRAWGARAPRDVGSADPPHVPQARALLQDEFAPVLAVRAWFLAASKSADVAAEATHFPLRGFQPSSLSSSPSASRGPVSPGHLSPGLSQRVRSIHLPLSASPPAPLATCARAEPSGLSKSPHWGPHV